MRHPTLLTILKHTFIPHQKNEYKPHFFREHVILSILIGVIFLLVLSFTAHTIIRNTIVGSSIISTVLIDLTNKTRIEHGLQPLVSNQRLETAATLKGNDMNFRQYFSHFAPDGTTPWHWFAQAGYSFLYAGENLAINFTSSQAVKEAWLNSPKHRENILGSQFEDIGIATVKGMSDSLPTIFVVQLFGTQQPELQGSLYVPDAKPTEKTIQHARLYQKLIFNASYYITTIYLYLVGILIIALGLMIFIEIRQQHPRHILLGILLLLAVMICIGINSYLL